MWGLLGFDLVPTRVRAPLGVRTLLGMHQQQEDSSLNLSGFLIPTLGANVKRNPFRSQKCASSLHHALCFPRLRGDLAMSLPRLWGDLVLVLPRLRARLE